jgi:hypothetical protein
LSLGWIVVDSCILPLAMYERLRPPKVGPIDLIVPHSIREEMLRKLGITRAEMVHVIRESIRIRQSRNQTVRQLKYREGVIFKTLERMWESTYGRIGPLNKTDKQVELLLQQVTRRASSPPAPPSPFGEGWKRCPATSERSQYRQETDWCTYRSVEYAEQW